MIRTARLTGLPLAESDLLNSPRSSVASHPFRAPRLGCLAWVRCYFTKEALGARRGGRPTSPGSLDRVVDSEGRSEPQGSPRKANRASPLTIIVTLHSSETCV